MKWVNIEKGIITDGFGCRGSLDAPYISTIDENGNYSSLDMIELDDLMITPILLLNKKGYKTEWCCSGHVYEHGNTGYIRFIDNIFMYNYVIKPNGKINLNNNKYLYIDDNKTIRAKDDKKDTMTLRELNKSIMDFNMEILKWALALPNFDELSTTLHEHNNKKSTKKRINTVNDEDIKTNKRIPSIRDYMNIPKKDNSSNTNEILTIDDFMSKNNNDDIVDVDKYL